MLLCKSSGDIWGVSGGIRVYYQTLYTAMLASNEKIFQAVAEAPSLFLATFYFESKDATSPIREVFS